MWQGRDIVFQDSEFYDRDFSLDFGLSIFFRFLREKGGKGRISRGGGGGTGTPGTPNYSLLGYTRDK